MPRADRAACATMARVRRTIAATFSSLQVEKQQLWKQGLISHFKTLKTLLRQGIAVRGNTDLESNIYQFKLDKASSDKGLELLLKEKTLCDSPRHPRREKSDASFECSEKFVARYPGE